MERHGRAERAQRRHRRFYHDGMANHRAGAWHHARRHLNSTTVHFSVDKTLDLAETGLNGWQPKQRMGVQMINASPSASHLEFAWVVAESPSVVRKPPRCQQLAEPDSPSSSDLWYTQLRASSDASCKDSGSWVSSKGLVSTMTKPVQKPKLFSLNT